MSHHNNKQCKTKIQTHNQFAIPHCIHKIRLFTQQHTNRLDLINIQFRLQSSCSQSNTPDRIKIHRLIISPRLPQYNFPRRIDLQCNATV